MIASRYHPAAYAARLAQYWFPVALGLLFLIALPGLILFAMNLLGLEADANTWLQQNFKLTYSIGLPWWGILILLLMPFLILLLYFLKLKRKPIQVPSTFLWRKSIEDLHVNSLLQWLRQNVLLLLQLLIVVVCIYSVMSFRFHGRVGEGKYYILMIDNSASMSAVDIKPNRLAWAKEEALKEIDAAGEDDVGMVIVFNSSAQTIQSRTSNRDLLRSAVRGIEPTQRPTRIDQALELAESLANPSKSAENEASRPAGDKPEGVELTFAPTEGTATEVHLFSDGRFRDVAEFNLGNLNIQYHMAGNADPEKTNNVGIIACSALRDETDPTRLQVFVSVRNFRAEEVKTRVELEYTVNGQRDFLPNKEFVLPARVVKEEKEDGKDTPRINDTPGDASDTFELKDLDETADVTIRVRLLDVQDDFPLDNEAWLVVGVVRRGRILIVGKPNEILKAFFDDEATKSVAKVEYLTPDKLGTEAYLKPAMAGAYDLVIFDRCSPTKEEEMPRANTFFIGHPPPPWKPVGSEDKEGKLVEKLENPHIKGWMGKHSVMKYLTALHEIGISEGFRMKVKDLPDRTPKLLETDGDTALMLTLPRQSFVDLVMTFPILNDKNEWNTNWPLMPSFPLFLRNVLYSLGNVSDAVSEAPTQPGDVKQIKPDAAVEEIQVIPPGGKPILLKRGSRSDFSFGGTDKVGIYHVAWEGAIQRSFAVNLLDSEESNLEPRKTVQIGNEEVQVGKTRGLPLELWRWFLLAVMGLLMLEWYIYNRRVYI
ncbi:MAG: VWA domain-containing protein [Gemmataceae bacterium]|nr:VWA domain-containing protein [Gemmataceae bacterium]